MNLKKKRIVGFPVNTYVEVEKASFIEFRCFQSNYFKKKIIDKDKDKKKIKKKIKIKIKIINIQCFSFTCLYNEEILAFRD